MQPIFAAAEIMIY